MVHHLPRSNTIVPSILARNVFTNSQGICHAVTVTWNSQRNTDNSETEGEEGSDNANIEEQHADWTLGNISQTISAQLSGGEKSKSNSCNKEQTDKGEAKKNRNKINLWNSKWCWQSRWGNGTSDQIPSQKTLTALSILGPFYRGGFWKTCDRRIRVGS